MVQALLYYTNIILYYIILYYIILYYGPEEIELTTSLEHCHHLYRLMKESDI